MHILIAIENANLRRSLEYLLSEEAGVNIVGQVSECEGMLALINSTKPDLVIFDENLPGCSFEDLLHQVHQQAFQPYLILLARDRRDEKTILATGVDAVVIKGEPPETLLAAFRRIRRLARSSQRTGGAKAPFGQDKLDTSD